MKRIHVVVVGLAVLALLGAPVRVSRSLRAAPRLTDLQGVDELKRLFNQDAGKVRLVLLVSPT